MDLTVISQNSIYLLVAFLLGLYQAFIYKKLGNYTKNFLVTLCFLPMLVSLVLLCVNGSVGTSIAILGVFSLVRFRSIQGNSKEILYIFYSMAIGLLVISGNILFAIIVSIVIGLLILLLNNLNLFEEKDVNELKITVPEDLNYDDVFEGILKLYCDSYELKRIKTSNMGTLFELSYEVVLRKGVKTKELLDSIRSKNANLNVSINMVDDSDLKL
mgnify:CR=1 FL=1